MNKKVYVGLSGGVDSSVTALLLQQQGYDLTGVFMKNWSSDIAGWQCPWKDDYRDAKRVAMQLGIPFKMYDFQTEYKSKVVDYLVAEYSAGRTPNPDIMCNQEVKFKLFLETALSDGADMIATGHYAQIKNDNELHMAVDKTKDQTYFSSRVSAEALQRTLFPLGGIEKSEVRSIAAEHNLITAAKKDSVGICFVGQVGIRDFLNEFVHTQPGAIINELGENIGTHEGALFYTIGQRHGLNLGGGLPYYVTGKDMDTNEVYVTSDISSKKLWNDQIRLSGMHWIHVTDEPDFMVRTRHLGELTSAKLDGENTLQLQKDIRALTPGQTAALYQGTQLLGSGIIC